MARRKQEPVFSKLKMMDADLSPERQQIVHPVRETHITIAAETAEHWVYYQPEPVETEESAVISAKIDPIAFLESSFVLVPPGTFLMGSPAYEPGRNGDETLHEVTLTKRFYIQKTPVTQGLWKTLMGSNPASFLNGGGDCPVESISWNECQAFIRMLSAKMGYICRLPTEAEWEYACRAGSGTLFFDWEKSGSPLAHEPLLEDAGWYCGNSGRKSRPVAQKSPNAWGLCDMHGNVCEWCQDWYGEYGSDSRIDPRGPQSGSEKVIRGGSWFSSANDCRPASRSSWPPNSRSEFIGFRLVKEVPIEIPMSDKPQA
jgi:formylglycine-generating enzyme required for sulfatase activity